MEDEIELSAKGTKKKKRKNEMNDRMNGNDGEKSNWIKFGRKNNNENEKKERTFFPKKINLKWNEWMNGWMKDSNIEGKGEETKWINK